MIYSILGVFLILTVSTYVPGLLFRRRQVAELSQRCRGRLVLTFDDGPGPQITPRLLALLARHQAKATFFLTGFRAERCPDLWQRLIAEGHDVGTHAFWHRDAWRFPLRSVLDVVAGCRQISGTPGGSRLYRPPNGHMTAWTQAASALQGFRPAFWTIDSGDYLDPPRPIEQVVAEFRRDGGGVILLHDLETGTPVEGRRHAHLLAVVEELLVVSRAEGYKVCTMSEVLGQPSQSRGVSRDV